LSGSGFVVFGVNALNVGRSPRETLRLVSAFQTGELTGCEWQPGQQFVQTA
jgi:alkyl hydroperoxide reductase subunit AhpC